MKKLKLLSILLVGIISSFFFVNKVNALFKSIPEPKINTFTLKSKTDYIIKHNQMNLDGVTYTTVETLEGEIDIGLPLSPEVHTYEGFITPDRQTVIAGFDTVTIIYEYDREQYELTVENSENVNPSNASGTYYYGTQIHLIANQYDSQGREFVKWSNGVENPDYTFTMTEDVTISPIYSNPYEITFVTNGGSPNPSPITRNEGEALGTLPTVTYDDCDSGTGSYGERNCTYVYEFKGWYKDSSFTQKVNEDYIVNSDMTLYARWNKIYFHNDQATFNGTASTMIDTDMELFSEENADKDFIVTFTLDSMAGTQTSRAAMFANMDERAEPYPGTMFRYDKNKFELVANVSTGGGKKTKNINNFAVGKTFVLKRESGIIKYSVDGGETFTTINDFTSFNKYFDYHATFGGEYDAQQRPYRFFDGTLSDMTVELIDSPHYTIHFEGNSGTGFMEDQIYALYASKPLKANSFKKHAYMFTGWNTSPDGTGTSYSDEQVVSGLGNENDVITLYAQWEEAPHYSVHFDANGGTGTMEDQQLYVGEAQNLSSSQFTKEDYLFGSWNTSPDGTGTKYYDEEEVLNLSTTNNDVVTLYAQYVKSEFDYEGEISFDGIDDYLDTGINILSRENVDRDFDIDFTIVYVDPNLENPVEKYQTTIMNAKDETHTVSGELVPGFVVRIPYNNTDTVNFVSYWLNNGSSQDHRERTSNLPIQVHYERRNQVVTLRYTYNDTTVEYELYDQKLAPLNNYSPLNIVFGASQDKNQVYTRFFKGTISDIHVEVYD
jgi:uncharacterized repeat protein (TIGR02543 family)